MEYSTLDSAPTIGGSRVVPEWGSWYDRFERLSDPRKAKGKRYQLVNLLVIIFLAKLCGRDRPLEIADWAKNHASELVELLKLKRLWMPHHNTIRHWLVKSEVIIC
jgi:hypothetical protein